MSQSSSAVAASYCSSLSRTAPMPEGSSGRQADVGVGGQLAVDHLRRDAFLGQDVVDEELRGVRAVGARGDQPELDVGPARPRREVLAEAELVALVGVVAELGRGQEAEEGLLLARRADGLGDRVVGVGEQRAVRREGLDPGPHGALVAAVELLAELGLVGGRHVVVVVHLGLVEPVRIGRLRERVVEGDLALPFRGGQLPEVLHRAGVVDLGVVGPDAGVGGDRERVLELGRDLVRHVGRQPALDEASAAGAGRGRRGRR